MSDPLPEIIYNVSQTQLSIARYYGGIKYNGHMYIYNPKDDTLIKSLPQKKKAKNERTSTNQLSRTNRSARL